MATIGFRVKLGLWSGTGEDVAMVISGGASIRGGMFRKGKRSTLPVTAAAAAAAAAAASYHVD